MKKRVLTLILVTVTALMTSACGNRSITMEKMADANRTSMLLSNYDSFSITTEYDNGSKYEYYGEEEFIYDSDGGYHAISAEDYGYFCDNGIYGRHLYVGCAPDNAWSENLLMSENASTTDEILEYTKSGNTATLKTQMTADGLAKLNESAGEKKVTSVEMEYSLDADTLAILSGKTVATYDDGTTETVKSTVQYNADRPEMAEELYKRATQTEDIRTLTVICHAGEENEAAYSATVPKGGDIVDIYVGEEFESQLYTDPQCTQPKENTVDYNADSTYYVKAAN